MVDINKLVSSKWNLPILQALKIEALCNNLVVIRTEKQLKDTLMNILGGNKSTVKRIIKLYPLKK